MAATLDFQVYADSANVTLRNIEMALTGAGLSIFVSTRVRQWLQERAEARFAAEGDDASGRWVPLSDTTNKIRESLGYPPVTPINVRTGELKRHVESGKGDVGIDAFGVTYHWPGGTIAPGLERKMRGAQVGGTRQPARPVAAVNIQDAAGVLVLLSDFILGPQFRGGMGRS